MGWTIDCPVGATGCSCSLRQREQKCGVLLGVQRLYVGFVFRFLDVVEPSAGGESVERQTQKNPVLEQRIGLFD